MKTGDHRTMRVLLALTLALTATIGCSSSFAAEAKKLKAGTVLQDCPTCPSLVVIPPGEFMMGFDGGEKDRYEGPVRKMRITKAIAVGRYEVTNAEYAAFIKATHYQPWNECRVTTGFGFKNTPDTNWQNTGDGHTPGDRDPVVCVNWKDAYAYAQWLAKSTGLPYRLLSEAEWEYGATAGATTEYPWGNAPNEACKYANTLDVSGKAAEGLEKTACDDDFITVAPVGSFTPNKFGLYDMIGNVWEWAQDCYVMPYPATPTDGTAIEAPGDCERRAVRGGSWSSNVYHQRPSWRGRDPELRASNIFGFRIARDLTPKER